MIRSMVDGGGGGVQRAEDQVAGLGRLDGDRDRLEVAHLAHQDDVRVLAQRRPERVLERAGVDRDLPLGHQALLARVHELDRVLDRDDVVGPGPVDQVDHRRERGALARPGGPGHDHQALGEVAEVLHLAAEAHLVRGPDAGGDDPEDRHRAVPVAARVAAEPGQALDLVGPVGVARLAKLADLARRHDAVEHRPRAARRGPAGGPRGPARRAVGAAAARRYGGGGRTRPRPPAARNSSSIAARASASSAALRPAVAPAAPGHPAPPRRPDRDRPAAPPAPGVSATVTCPLGER